MIESSKEVKPWREAVKWAALEQVKTPRIVGAISLDIGFILQRPKSLPKKRQFPDRKPDLSKLIRSTEDALTDAGVWEDDARVIRVLATKRYQRHNENTGAIINVFPYIGKMEDR
jgi:crossover junction endodeoxyribonuclease RusA